MATPGTIRAGGASVEVSIDDKVSAGLNRVKAKLDGLKKFAGEDSALGSLAKVAVGAGALAGVTAIGNALANAAKRGEDLVTQFRAGEISAGALADGLARAVPLLGSLYAAGASLHEMVAGEKALAAELEKRAKITKELVDLQKQLAGAVDQVTADTAAKAASTRLQNQSRTGGIVGGSLADLQLNRLAAGEKIKAELDKITAATGGPLAALEKQAAGFKTQGDAVQKQLEAALKRQAELTDLAKVLPRGPYGANGAEIEMDIVGKKIRELQAELNRVRTQQAGVEGSVSDARNRLDDPNLQFLIRDAAGKALFESLGSLAKRLTEAGNPFVERLRTFAENFAEQQKKIEEAARAAADAQARTDESERQRAANAYRFMMEDMQRRRAEREARERTVYDYSAENLGSFSASALARMAPTVDVTQRQIKDGVKRTADGMTRWLQIAEQVMGQRFG